jgi:hypothetical protein
MEDPNAFLSAIRSSKIALDLCNAGIFATSLLEWLHMSETRRLFRREH